MRWLALLLAMAAMAARPAPAQPPAEFVQAVEFPYYLIPPGEWERNLVRLKEAGVRTVAFSVPWNWHEPTPGAYDFTGRTNPRRDLIGLIRLLQKLGLRAWVRPLPPVAGWRGAGVPEAAAGGSTAQAEWLKRLGQVLATRTASHGGPVAYVEGARLGIDAGAPPSPVTTISAGDSAAFAKSRDAIAGLPGRARGALLWTDVETAIYPAGWAAASGAMVRPGALAQQEGDSLGVRALLRDTALLRNWSALLPGLRPIALPAQPSGKLPAGVRAVELISSVGVAVTVTNGGKQPFRGDLRVFGADAKSTTTIPGVSVPAGESLWLPLGLSLGAGSLCRECSSFSPAEHIVYATAELLSVEFENGLLAMEFAAPEGGEAVLQLAREPVGPYLAAGTLKDFDWDAKTLRARLPIPPGSGPAARVRIGIAMEAPEDAAFFDDPPRLIAGRINVLNTVYSSAAVAARSRLLAPEGYSATARKKSPNEIEYAVAVPADAVPGDWANLAIEADGVPLGRARLQVFRPASITLPQAVKLHFGDRIAAAPDPPIVAIEPRGGANVDITIANHTQGIQTYHLSAAAEGLDFLPAKMDVSVGALAERTVSLRVFPAEGVVGLRDWRLSVTGGMEASLPFRFAVLSRNGEGAWSADLDADGSPEWVLESHRARAVFSSRDGGRWIEYAWKDSGVNFVPEQGAFAAPGDVEVAASGGALTFAGRNWKRTARLTDAGLMIEQNTPLPADHMAPEKRGGATLRIDRNSPGAAVYRLE